MNNYENLIYTFPDYEIVENEYDDSEYFYSNSLFEKYVNYFPDYSSYVFFEMNKDVILKFDFAGDLIAVLIDKCKKLIGYEINMYNVNFSKIVSDVHFIQKTIINFTQKIIDDNKEILREEEIAKLIEIIYEKLKYKNYDLTIDYYRIVNVANLIVSYGFSGKLDI